MEIINVALNEIGYLEKKSNCNLDSKTENAGSNNYTKYWRDVAPAYQAQPWCACFVTWVLNQVYGKEQTLKLLYHYPFVYCPTLANLGKQKKQLYTIEECKQGDIVLFHNGSEYCHTGIVVCNSDGRITTIEGNTSGGSTVVANGGGVAKKTYTYEYIKASKTMTRFFRPKYTDEEGLTMSQYEELKAMIESIAKENERQNKVIDMVGQDIQELKDGHAKQNDLLYDIRTKVGV